MTIRSEADIIQLIREDAWMMELLKAARALDLPDWWICSGFVRSKVWDVIHNFDVRTPLPDIDVIYFDPLHLEEAVEKKLEEQLRILHSHIPWSVKNEARMHLVNKIPPYSSSTDAISKFPETVTALGLTLDNNNEVVLTAPCGIEDLIKCVIKPTAFVRQTKGMAEIYKSRILKKNWKAIWGKVTVENGVW
jgi:hypothetical protein